MSAAYMRMFWGDFLKNTMHLTSAEVGVYVLLIAHYFEQGCLPDDDKRLARIARMPVPNWKKMRPVIEEFFEPGWRHARIDAEIEESRRKSDRATRSAKTRWKIDVMTPIPDTSHGKEFDATTTGQKIIKTMDGLCERIADASKLTCSSESESESKKDTTLHAGARFAEIEGKLREAAGLVNAPSPGLFVVGPIIACIDGGCDLELDVLPTIRARTHGRVSSWKFFVEAIWEAKATREAAGQARAATPASRSVQAPMPKDWRPTSEDVDYGKKLGFSQGDLDWAAERLRQWATGKTATDWSATYRSNLASKAERDGKRLPVAGSAATVDPKAAAEDFYAKMAERQKERLG